MIPRNGCGLSEKIRHKQRKTNNRKQTMEDTNQVSPTPVEIVRDLPTIIDTIILFIPLSDSRYLAITDDLTKLRKVCYYRSPEQRGSSFAELCRILIVHLGMLRQDSPQWQKIISAIVSHVPYEQLNP